MKVQLVFQFSVFARLPSYQDTILTVMTLKKSGGLQTRKNIVNILAKACKYWN